MTSIPERTNGGAEASCVMIGRIGSLEDDVQGLKIEVGDIKDAVDGARREATGAHENAVKAYIASQHCADGIQALDIRVGDRLGKFLDDLDRREESIRRDQTRLSLRVEKLEDSIVEAKEDKADRAMNDAAFRSGTDLEIEKLRAEIERLNGLRARESDHRELALEAKSRAEIELAAAHTAREKAEADRVNAESARIHAQANARKMLIAAVAAAITTIATGVGAALHLLP